MGGYSVQRHDWDWIRATRVETRVQQKTCLFYDLGFPDGRKWDVCEALQMQACVAASGS